MKVIELTGHLRIRKEAKGTLCAGVYTTEYKPDPVCQEAATKLRLAGDTLKALCDYDLPHAARYLVDNILRELDA